MIKNYIIIVITLFLLLITGCARVIVFYPIEKSDFFRITKDTKVGNLTAEKDGWFMSDLYLTEVAGVKKVK